MREQAGVRKREKWVDGVKNIACILVVVGHFFQSMMKADILSSGHLYEWFNTTIYYFHVPLFFICSGYLYQKNSKINDFSSWFEHVTRKILNLGVPYLTFSTVTWVLKYVFSGSVNDQIGGFWDTLLLNPTAPYWYLYALFFIFLITPTYNGTKMATIGLVIALAAKLLILTCRVDWAYAESTVFSNEIWFVFGMAVCAFNVQMKGKKLLGVVGGLMFITLSVVIHIMGVHSDVISFVLGILACTSVVLLIADYEDKVDRVLGFFTKYTMPIFLMHTLFAATLRVILLKIGITSTVVHIVLGLGISFVGPILAAWIMERVKWLEFFLYPNKFLKRIGNTHQEYL